MTRMTFMNFVASFFIYATQSGQSYKPDSNWIVPEKATHRENPLKPEHQVVAGGRKLYQRRCSSCHGDETHGQTKNAPDLSRDAVQSQPDGALLWRISSGNSRRGMPAFGGLPEGQRWQLVLYIRSLRGTLHVESK